MTSNGAPTAWLRPVAAATGAAVAGVATERLRSAYRTGIEAAYADLADRDTASVETPHGTVEYRRAGEGVPAVVAHGAVGGSDAAMAAGESLLPGGFEVVAPSRFGYLGSDLPADPTPENQADAYAAVLDDCGVDRAVVLGVSAGGTPALAFALRHPERTRALVLVGATAPGGPLTAVRGPPAPLLRDFPFWVLVEYGRPALDRLFGVGRRDGRTASPAERAAVDRVLDARLPVEPRRPGAIIDRRVTAAAMVERPEDFDAGTLAVPLLVVHARDDPLAPFEAVERLVGRAPDAELTAFEDGGHLLVGHGDAVRRTVGEFVATESEADDGPASRLRRYLP